MAGRRGLVSSLAALFLQRAATVTLLAPMCGTTTASTVTALRIDRGLARRAARVRECSACVRDCSRSGAEFLCSETYRNYTRDSLKPVSGCNCEEDGWDYPYMNPGGPAGGQFTWKCCFDHYCHPEP